MVRCRYLAIDYESEFAQNRKKLRDKLTITSISPSADDIRRRNDIFSYRTPWIGVPREKVNFKESDIEQLLKCVIPPKVNADFEALPKRILGSLNVEPESFSKIDILTKSKDALVFEEIQQLDGLKKSQPSVTRLLRKHSNLVLSDPYEEIRDISKTYEKLNTTKTNTIPQNDRALDVGESQSDCFSENSKFNLEEDFIEEIQETNDEVPELETNTAALESIEINNTTSVEKEFSSYVKTKSKDFTENDEISMTKSKINQVKEIECLQVDQVLENIASSELEIPFSYPLLNNNTVVDTWKIIDTKKLKIDTVSGSDLQKMVDCSTIGNIFVNGLEKENWSTARVSHLLLSEAKLKELNSRKINDSESVKCIELCRPLSKLPTSEEKLGLHWNVTSHVKNLVIKLQKPEKLVIRTLKQKPGSIENSYTTDAEIFDQLILMMDDSKEDPPDTPEQDERNVETIIRKEQICDLDLTEDYHARELEKEITKKNERESTPANISNEYTNQMKQQDPSMKQNISCTEKNRSTKEKNFLRGSDESSFDSFLQMRGRTMKQRIQNFTKAGSIPKTSNIAGSTKYKPDIPSTLPSDGSSNKNLTASTPRPPDIMKVEKSNYKLVKVNITGGMLRMILDIDNYIEPVFKQLKTLRVLPKECVIANINEEMSKYLLKQSKRFIQDGSDVAQHPSYVLLVMLHCFIVCKSRIVNMSPTSALGFLIDFYHNNKDMLEHLMHFDEFNDLKSMLSLIPLAIHTLKQTITNSQLIHPKITELGKIIYERLYKDSRRSSSETKILILSSTKCNHLFDEIVHVLIDNCSADIGVKPIALPSSLPQQYTTDDFVKNAITSGCNIVILPVAALTSSFPWEKFMVLLEYEAQKDSPWKRISSELGIRHIALMTESTESALSMDEEINNNENDITTLIGSTTITNCGNLLHLLETRYNIEIIERDYVELYKNSITSSDSQTYGYPDIIINEKTCVIVENFSSLNGDEGSQILQKIFFKVLDLQARFTKRYVIIADLNSKKSGYSMKGNFPLLLSKLHTALENFFHNESVFEMKLYCSFDVEHFAHLINRLIEISSSNQSMDKMKSREQLSISASSHEQFLLQFPSINPLIAQYMLSNASLRQIASLNIAELNENFPLISKDVLQDFHSKLHSPGQHFPVFVDDEDVDITPEFSFKLEGNDSMEFGKHQDENTDFSAYFGCELQATEYPEYSINDFDSSMSFGQNIPSTSSSFNSCSNKNDPNPCRKRLRFEKIKEWKDGQTRLAYY